MTISANQLRWLAEAADGQRDTSLLLKIDQRGTVTLQPKGASAVAPGEVEILTPSEGQGCPGDTVLTIDYQGNSMPLAKADAIFWTQSAVEKFVLPYYTRFRTPNEIQSLKDLLFTAGCVAAVHYPPSITLGLAGGVKGLTVSQAGVVTLTSFI